MGNPGLEKRKETAKRQLLFAVPRVVAVSPQMRLVEDNPSSLSLLDIYKLRCSKTNVDHDAPIARYYEKLTAIQDKKSQVTHKDLCDVLRDVQTYMVPRSMLKEWAINTFADATDYWTFRKSLTLHLALLCFAEHALHLTFLRPEMLQIAQDSGRLHSAYFRFDMSDSTGNLNSAEDSNNSNVAFRLTPNICEFVTQVGINSVLSTALIATSRCFMQPNFKVEGLLRAVLRDEIIVWHKKRHDENNSAYQTTTEKTNPPPDIASNQLVSLVDNAVTWIMKRIQELAEMEGGGENKVSLLVDSSIKNLCRMDPAWHPWL